jgi:hypothetical protein
MDQQVQYTLFTILANNTLKNSMNSFDREDNYYNVSSVKFEITTFLIKERFNNNSISKEKISKLISLHKKLRFICNEFEKEFYFNWIESKNYKIIKKSAAHYTRKLDCYYRKFNFKIISHNDPFTEDEKEYCLEFNKDVFPELNYQCFEDIDTIKIQAALNNLLSN